MKAILLAIFITGALAKPTSLSYDDYRWSLVKDGEGKMHVFNMNPVELEPEVEPNFDPINDMFFLLFTRDNPTVGQRIDINNEASLRASNWRINSQTRFLIHGWTASANSGENFFTRDEFLRLADHNVVVVDWSVGAGSPNYIVSRNRVGPAGNVVGQFIDWLTGLGFTHPSRINVVGISLGAHVSGNTGKNTRSGKINAIFGNDPAGPLFNIESTDRLDFEDALYTESIMTNAGQLGIDIPITHASFWPNWGASQPGCGIDVGGGCAHARSTHLYSESVNSALFVARQCANFSEIGAQNCPGTGFTAIMGGDQAKAIRGVFFLETNGEAPFARG